MGTTLERGSLLHKRYRIVEILGQGGMGSVYRAVDENLGVDVAVKENLFTTDEYARQFRLEAVILANLRHPNLPRVTDHFVIGDQGQYLIMDYIEGEDLRQRMERVGAVSEEEAVLIGAAMCEALQYLHTRKPSIIHRDVKPGNVRIAPDGHIYLVDFGLAKLVKGSQATTTGARAMTPGYSPPEQYGTARTDPRTDVYSLGATLYAALTGVIPEDGLARAMDNVELTPLRKRNPRVSRKLAAAIEKAMAVRPEDRFQSADDFRQALLTSNVKTQRLEGEILVEPPPQAPGSEGNSKLEREIQTAAENVPPSRPPSRPRKKRRSTSWWIFFSFFLLTILAVVLAVLFFFSPLSKIIGLNVTETSSPVPATSTMTATVVLATNTATQILPSKTASPVPSPTITRTPMPTFTPSITPTPTETALPSSTPAGGGYGQIAFVSDRTGVPQIFIMNPDGSDQHQITILPDGACQPSWSPDGSQIVFVSPCLERKSEYPGSKLYITAADGKGLVELPNAEGFEPAWGPDGVRIAFTSLREGSAQIYIYSFLDNSVIRVTEASANVRLPDTSRQPVWSPSGAQIVYTAHDRLTDTSQIWVMSDAGRSPALLIRRGTGFNDSLPSWSPDGKTILFTEVPVGMPQTSSGVMTFDFENRATAEATHMRDAVYKSSIYGTHPSYSPDGHWVIYEGIDLNQTSRLDNDIYVLGEMTRQTRLVNDLAEDFDPAWRPIKLP